MAQLRDSLGDGQEMRPPEGEGGATRAGALIFVGSRHPEGLRPDAAVYSPRPSWTALGVVQHRDSLGDGGGIRRSESAGAATVPVLLISVGSRNLEGLRLG